MRFKAAIGAGVVLAALGLSQVLAQPFPRQGGFPGKGPGPGQPMPMPGPGQFGRQVERPQPPERPPFEQRMSPEERRQLRRDIEQHGREIYPNRGRQGRR